jgi:hypothetical protein
MSRLIQARLERTIAAEHELIQRLCRSSHQADLDTLYVNLLSTYSNRHERAGDLLCTIALVREPPTPNLLSALLDMPSQEVIALLRTFVDDRIIVTGTSGDTLITDTTALCVRLSSLNDLVVDPVQDRLQEDLLDPADSQQKLLYRCLQLLNKHLRQDICGIRDYRLANADIPDLPLRVIRSIPEAVRYACRFWLVHLLSSGALAESVAAVLLDFCTRHLLHWLEVQSLLRDIPSTAHHLRHVKVWCQVSIRLASKPCLNEPHRTM